MPAAIAAIRGPAALPRKSASSTETLAAAGPPTLAATPASSMYTSRPFHAGCDASRYALPIATISAHPIAIVQRQSTHARTASSGASRQHAHQTSATAQYADTTIISRERHELATFRSDVGAMSGRARCRIEPAMPALTSTSATSARRKSTVFPMAMAPHTTPAPARTRATALRITRHPPSSASSVPHSRARHPDCPRPDQT